MKKVFALILALLMAMTVFVACGDKDDDSDSSSGNSSAKSAVSQYMESSRTMNLSKFLEVQYAPHFNKNKSYDEYKEEYDAQYDELKESGQLDKMKEQRKDYTFEVVDEEEWDEDRVKEKAEDLSSKYNDTDKITAITDVKVERTKDGDTESHTYTAVECDGKWYVLD